MLPEVGGLYVHFKGGVYEVLHVAKCAETSALVIVYRSFDTQEVYVRDFEDWKRPSMLTGEPVERYKRLKG
jgi:hypothetical protein